METDDDSPPAAEVPYESPAALQERLDALIKKRKNLEADVYLKRRQLPSFVGDTTNEWDMADDSTKAAGASSVPFDDLPLQEQHSLLTAANRMAGITLETADDESYMAFRLDVRPTASYRLVLQLHSSTTTLDGAQYFRVVVRHQQLPIADDAVAIVERHMGQSVVKANRLLTTLRSIVQEVYFQCHCVHVRQDCVEYLEELATVEDESRSFHIDAVEVDSSTGKNRRVEFTIVHPLSRVGKLDVILEWAEGSENPEAIVTVPMPADAGDDSTKATTLLNLMDAAKAAFRNHSIHQALEKVSSAMAEN